MKQKLSYTIIGPGALGGLYGARLHHAGFKTHFLYRSEYEHVRQHGLRVDSPWGDLHLSDLSIFRSVEDLPPADVVCVCLKTTSNHLLSSLLPSVAGEGTVVVLLQNGLGVEQEVQALAPDALVAGGLCYLCSNRVGQGHIHHVDYGRITLAAHSPGMDEVLETIAADFNAAGIPTDLAPDLALARWKKLVWNIPYNGLCVVLQTETDRIMADPDARELARQLILEVMAGARACGSVIEESYEPMIMEFTDKMKPYSPSMKLDYQAGRPLEIEYLYERPLNAARTMGVDLPRIAMLTAQLRFLDRVNTA